MSARVSTLWYFVQGIIEIRCFNIRGGARIVLFARDEGGGYRLGWDGTNSYAKRTRGQDHIWIHNPKGGRISPPPAGWWSLFLFQKGEFMWCKLCGAIYVVQSMWCSPCGAIYVLQSMWCRLCGASYVMQGMWCSLGGATRYKAMQSEGKQRKAI